MPPRRRIREDAGRAAVSAWEEHGESLDRSTLATDGRYLYFVWSEEQGDLWVMKVAKH